MKDGKVSTCFSVKERCIMGNLQQQSSSRPDSPLGPDEVPTDPANSPSNYMQQGESRRWPAGGDAASDEPRSTIAGRTSLRCGRQL